MIKLFLGFVLISAALSGSPQLAEATGWSADVVNPEVANQLDKYWLCVSTNSRETWSSCSAAQQHSEFSVTGDTVEIGHKNYNSALYSYGFIPTNSDHVELTLNYRIEGSVDEDDSVLVVLQYLPTGENQVARKTYNLAPTAETLGTNQTLSKDLIDLAGSKISFAILVDNDATEPTRLILNDITLTASTYSSIGASVITEAGESVPNAEVTLRTAEGELVDQTETDEHGYFGFINLSGQTEPHYLIIKADDAVYRKELAIAWGETYQRILRLNADASVNAYRLPSASWYRWLGSTVKENGDRLVLWEVRRSNTDSITWKLSALNLTTGKIRLKKTLNSHINTTTNSGTVFSDNGKYIATAFDNYIFDDTYGSSHRLEFWSTVRQKKLKSIQLEDGQYFSEYNGGDTYGGASSYQIEWISRSCVRASIFQDDPAADHPDRKILLEKRRYCL